MPTLDIEQLKRDIADHGPSDAQVRGLLEMVKERILAEPETYSQVTFCGMACCIGGHIDLVINGRHAHQEHRMDEIADIARSAIGEDEFPWLLGSIRRPSMDDDMFAELWPWDLSLEYVNNTNAGRAIVGCKAIDRYMKERGI